MTRAVSLTFPVGGLHEYLPFDRQPEGTTPDVQNCRPHDPGTGRARGAQRPGLSRHIDAQVNSSNSIVCLEKFELAADYSGATTIAARTIKFAAISNGTLKIGTTSYSTPTNGTSAFATAVPAIYAARFYDDLYFADGTNTKYYDSSDNAVKTWSANYGSHPGGGCRLIATYRDRIILSGLQSDPQNFFASAVGDPTDFDYSPATVTSEIAFAGNAGNPATIGDKIMALCPIPDQDVMLFGCDHSIVQMTGDIAAGGRIDRLSDTVGMAWGRPFCFNPQGLCYFFGSRGGVYAVAANSKPRRLTGDKIDERLADVNTTSTLITMAWDDRQQGAYLFITPLDGSSTTNYFYDERTDSWWKDVFADDNHNPVSVLTFDGDDPGDRAVLLGCQDGYVRAVDVDATNDDQSAVSSYVYLGPIQGGAIESVLVDEIQASLASGSSDVTWELYRGDNAEEAFNSTAVWSTGTWVAGRNAPNRKRAQGSCLWLKLKNTTASETWSLEKVELAVRSVGRRKQRITA